eukprot:2391698-Pleurochrysis_carterae.AAC.1
MEHELSSRQEIAETNLGVHRCQIPNDHCTSWRPSAAWGWAISVQAESIAVPSLQNVETCMLAGRGGACSCESPVSCACASAEGESARMRSARSARPSHSPSARHKARGSGGARSPDGGAISAEPSSSNSYVTAS